MQDFRKLAVWVKAHETVLHLYRVTAGFPRDELFGVTAQIRRSAASVPANIAEGCGRGGRRDFARYLTIALGSASELEYHLILAYDLKFLKHADYELTTKMVIEVKRMLTGLFQTVRTRAGEAGR